MTLVQSPNQVDISISLSKFLNVFNDNLEEIFSFLRPFSDEDLNNKPNSDAWSIIQVMHHLMIAEQTSIQYVVKKIAAKTDDVKRQSAASKLRAKVLITSLQQPIRLKVPDLHKKGIPTYATLADTKAKWLKQRQELQNYLSSLPEEWLDYEFFRHPYIGVMSLWSMLEYFDVHFQRHRKQIMRGVDFIRKNPSYSLQS